MWDFDKLPKDKLNAIREILKEVKAPKAFKEYTEVPVVERMAIMEKVYGQLGKDDEWWERFYRTKGYHLAKEGHAKEAVEARKRSLEMVRKFINDEKNESSKKLLLYIAGAMNHFIGDDEAAVKDFELALKTRYAEKGASAEDVASGEAGLNERLNEYIRLVRSSTEAPRKRDSSDSHDH
jgi:hypothetical protein